MVYPFKMQIVQRIVYIASYGLEDTQVIHRICYIDFREFYTRLQIHKEI